MTTNEGSVAQLYQKLSTERDDYLTLAREVSKYTLPNLIEPEGERSLTRRYRPWQSVGARLINNLSSKLQLTHMPPAQPFFRLTPSEDALKEFDESQRAEIDEALAKIEQKVLREFEVRAMRVHVFQAYKLLLVAGNALFYMGTDTTKVFPLGQYVLKRDPQGEVLEIIVKESMSRDTLPASLRSQLGEISDEEKERKNAPIDIYTRVTRVATEWRMTQEMRGKVVNRGRYELGRNPWLALRWNRQEGEAYGTGLGADYIGDLRVLENLAKFLVESAAASAKVLFMVNPAGLTRKKDLEKPSLSVIDGREADVTVLKTEKLSDFQIAKATFDDIVQRLGYAFLLGSAIRRDAERVTAEEIRLLASELEDAHGGSFSLLSVEFHLPMVQILMAQMTAKGAIPALPASVKPTIVTGVDALGRSHELAKLDTFVDGATQRFGPNALQAVNMSEYLRRRAVALGIETTGLVYTPEELAQQQQAAQQAQLMQQAVGPGIQAASRMMETNPVG